jgi:hypothetical protein
MIERTLVAGLALAAGAMLVPLAASAAGFNYGGFNYGGFGHLAGQSLVRPGQTPLVVVNTAPAPRNHLTGWEPLRHHRRVFGLALPVTGIAPYYVAPTATPEFDPGITGSLIGVPPTRDRLPVDRGGCRIEIRTVPSEAGGTRDIAITSCWQG